MLKEEERILSLLKKLNRENMISDLLFQKLKPVGSQPSRLYGLAKVHKHEIPMRPVLSMPGSAYFKIAVQVSEWLSVVGECKINSSTKIITDKLQHMKLNTGCPLCQECQELSGNLEILAKRQENARKF